MRYLVATDGSEESDEAVRFATTQAAALDASLVIVHVLQPEATLSGGELILPGGDKATEIGNQLLEQAKQLAVQSVDESVEDLSIETQLLAGRPADAITEHAQETDADAIYVGHRGLSEEREQVVGSVAKNVIDKATVPVTVTR